MSRGSGSVTWFLFGLGLVLRLAGLFFKGQHDMDQLVLEWGGSVYQNGLANTPIIIYGILSYVFHGIAFGLAEAAPRFWWAPQKFLEATAEVGVLIALIKLLPGGRTGAALWLYWLNPFFIVSGAWLGFWDAPHTLAALMAVLAVSRARGERTGWLLAGVALAVGAMFKPQGLIYFVMPVAIYLGLQAIVVRRWTVLLWVAAGGFASFAVAALCFGIIGGDPMEIPRSYLIGEIMPNLCNSCISVWRPVTRLLQRMLGQHGSLYELVLPGSMPRLADRIILISTELLVVAFALRMTMTSAVAAGANALVKRETRPLRVAGLAALVAAAVGMLHGSDPAMHPTLVLGRFSPAYAMILFMLIAVGAVFLAAAPFMSGLITRLFAWFGPRSRLASDATSLSPHHSLYLVLAFGALVIPQLGTRAHISHTYAGLVLLIPIAAVNAEILRSWIAMIAVHFYGYVSSYGVGAATALPSRDVTSYSAAARELIARIDPASHGRLLGLQGTVDGFFSRIFPQEPVLSLLSVLQFACVIYVVWELFTNLGRVYRLGEAQSPARSSTV